MAEDEDTPVGCGASRKKLEDDLIGRAEDSVINEDIVTLKKCIDEQTETTK